ncbi:carbohydrate-binding protein [Echinimonas agarilytica]|uniref:Carbohydrate-binding protein n=1 Tax=Echinimonas agarilytica TaxID=1215918 RepID=A0AA41W6H5_9GAMM|nr:carbohydrate-binding protein [Echinimonas agarilytica]MCM2679745.1 carbohydrate-binding protein [Echinimonas agarilytica]
MANYQKTALAILISSSFATYAADWDGLPVPADAGEGNVWVLQSLSDDFNYSAPAADKGEEFATRWKEGFINDWQGPGKTVWKPDNSSIEGGELILRASRIPLDFEDDAKAGGVYVGSITSKEHVNYPIYLEARAKLSNTVLANAFWLLSDDSTEEIDIIEAYGADGVDTDDDGVIDVDNSWFAARMHLSTHTFIRDPFTDYQPSDSEDVLGTWYHETGRTNWREEYHRVGVYWKAPNHIEYYIDGNWVRTMTDTGYSYLDPNGVVRSFETDFNPLDKYDYTNGTGLSKPMSVIINMEDQDWREEQGITPTDTTLADDTKNNYRVDWVRFYKPMSEAAAKDTSEWEEGERVTTTFGSFIETGKTGEECCGDTVLGFNVNGDLINYNTSGDWGEYTVEFAEAGHYRTEALIATSTATNIGLTVTLDDELMQSMSFDGTGDWGNYEARKSGDSFYVASAGTKTVRIASTGSSDWQWNGDSFSFIHLIDPDAVETDPEETDPEETDPEETDPEETDPEETDPEETDPEETDPEETDPEETDPEETDPEETDPEETDPEETDPEETTPETPAPEEEKSSSGGSFGILSVAWLALLGGVSAFRRRQQKL